MSRHLFLVVVAALAFVPAALADGPMPYAAQNGPGVLSPGGQLRYLAVAGDGNSTTVEAVATRGGTLHGFTQLLGAYGIPYVTTPADSGGLSTDGSTLVLGDASFASPRTKSAFAIIDTRRLRTRAVFFLKGDFAYDALSPDGSRLYLIQHTSANDLSRYVVRAYDVTTGKLLPGRVADRTQRSWVMSGYPMSRATSADGRWVYTLYDNPGGFPFVHALDTVRGVAHCIGLPWRGSDQAVYNLRLTLHGRALAVHWASGRRWLRMDTTSWRLSPDRVHSFPWWTLGFLALVPLLALALRRYHRVRDGGRARTLATRTA